MEEDTKIDTSRSFSKYNTSSTFGRSTPHRSGSQFNTPPTRATLNSSRSRSPSASAKKIHFSHSEDDDDKQFSSSMISTGSHRSDINDIFDDNDTFANLLTPSNAKQYRRLSSHLSTPNNLSVSIQERIDAGRSPQSDVRQF
jgi:hypothetical protein